ncbi:MAG: hypothetical protein HYV32_06080 [Candidatus Kerfeldbacteria bacterium]|nr:hypothetical protein [Candidatus Kerfeldbacteria bacterium]
MKKTSSIFSLLVIFTLFTPSVQAMKVATIGDTLKNSVNEDTQAAVNEAVNEAKDATFDARKEALITVLDKSETILADVETQLQQSDYASDETKSDGQAAIDDAQSQVNSLQAAVSSATTSAELDAARADTIAWLKANKDLAKDLVLDIYLDSLNAAIGADKEVVDAADALLPFFQADDALDTTTYASLLATAQDSLQTAQDDWDAAHNNPSQETLDTSTRSTVQASLDAAKLLEEADSLYSQMTE